ncbi:hypothetical protein MHYP_G00140130 [Metynnis hypsauchen]
MRKAAEVLNKRLLEAQMKKCIQQLLEENEKLQDELLMKDEKVEQMRQNENISKKTQRKKAKELKMQKKAEEKRRQEALKDKKLESREKMSFWSVKLFI